MPRRRYTTSTIASAVSPTSTRHTSSLQHDADDPLSLALRPPPDESAEQRELRLKAERDAKKVSDDIDESLRRERAEQRRAGVGAKHDVRVLLLGQSESGKSTTLKNFQMLYAPSQWRLERRAWTSVVHLNLVKNVALLFSSLPPSDPSLAPHLALQSRAARAELLFCARLGGDRDREPGDHRSGTQTHLPVPARPEFFVRSSASGGWKARLLGAAGASLEGRRGEPLPDDDVDEATEIVVACREAMVDLWHDPAVRAALRRRGARLEESAGFFLPNADRIARRNYDPSDDDVLRARLRTLGIQEHRFTFESGITRGQEWAIYDLGGMRSQRTAWLSFFDEMDAIIFIAPVSAFNEVLEEDHRVNRLEDSLTIWRALCQSPYLKKVTLVLFLNKIDLLKRKVEAGVQLARWVTSFGQRSNDVETICKYFRQKFRDIQEQNSAEHRPYFCFYTSVTDTTATRATLGAVREGILRSNLRHADFL